MMRRQARAQLRQAGVGLVEVMISMGIGLAILGAVGFLFVGSKQMSRTQSDVVRMQESARNAMDVLGKAARQAGYKLNVDYPLDSDAVAGSNGTGTGASATPDILILRHDPAWLADDSATPNPLLGRESDCEGNTVTSDNLPDATTGAPPINLNLVEYRFSVVDGKLLCSADPEAAAGAGVVVADNIENMQVSYGIGNGGESIVSYTDTPTALEFTRVSAIRISLLLRGPSPNVAVNGAQTYTYNGASATASDGRLRRVLTSTFTVRNQTRWK
ncbi:MAG: PilW family protein [Telluria sp.]